MLRFLLTGLLPAALLLVGACQSPTKHAVDDEPDPSEGLSVSVAATGLDKRYTLLVLDEKSRLSFGGGQDARAGKALYITTLTAAQRQRVWKVIEENHLTEAGNQFLRRAERVTYDVTIRPRGRIPGKSFRCVDDTVPGVRELHDLLFQYQAEVNYALPGLAPAPR